MSGGGGQVIGDRATLAAGPGCAAPHCAAVLAVHLDLRARAAAAGRLAAAAHAVGAELLRARRCVRG